MSLVIYRRIACVALLEIFLLSGSISSVLACTIFSGSNDETVLVGNNEDWQHTNFSIRFYPQISSRHGHVAFTDSENEWDIRAGMNTEGVFIDSTWVPASNVTIDPEKEFLPRNLFKYVLETCESVNETIEKFQQYNIAETWNWQILVADSYGDSVVIVAGPDETVEYIRKNGTYQLITNGNIAIPELGQSASSEQRYNAAQTLLEQMNGNYSISNFRDVLDAAHSQYTAFSTVYDLVNLDIYIYFNHDYSKEVMFNLEEELEKSRHTYVIYRLFEDVTTSNTTESSSTTTLTTTETSTSDMPFAIILSFSIVLSSIIVVLIMFHKSGKK